MMTLSFNTISEALSQPKSRFFGVGYENGRYAANDEVSFFRHKLPDPELTFDISNNKTLVNVNMNGLIKYITVYNGQYASDNIPGVWMCKDFRKSGPYAFALKLGEWRYDLGLDDLPYTTSLLDNLFPVTEYRLGDVKATLLIYTPISADGTARLRGAVYGLHVENRSGQEVDGEVLLPRPDTEADRLFSGPDVCIYPVEREDGYAAGGAVPFHLAPGQSVWVPVVICPPGEETALLIGEKGTLYWLNETWAYYRGMLGRLQMRDDPFAAEFYERAMLQSLGSIAMDRQGAVVGSNWGTYPTTEFTWNKDMYFSLLPFHTAEPELFKQGVLWFLKHGVRPAGNRYSGGISHSLSNSLSSVVMAGLYYRSTGDKRFFLEWPDIDISIRKLLEETLRTRNQDGPWLFPSDWLSDAYSLGDYHTGSNVVAWAAFHHYARIVREVFGDMETAEHYRTVAASIREDLQRHNTVEGPFGLQYTEGTSAGGDALKGDSSKYKGNYDDFGMQFIGHLMKDGSIDLFHRDGEESDTILMPLYGYASYDDTAYRHYMQFSLSPANPTYNPESRGIQWGEHAACTFPGYMSGMGMLTDFASMSGTDGYLTEIRKLTDADGSLWWWPYLNGASYGDVVRHHNCGKCGWASGVFSGLFTSRILGIAYDAPARQLSFRPLRAAGSFAWEGARLGSGVFNLSFRREDCIVEAVAANFGAKLVTVLVELPCEQGASPRTFVNGKPAGGRVDNGYYNGCTTVIFQETLQPGESKSFIIIAYAPCK
ncbi:hypothetical protein DFP94_1011252 [Fontibacillus phaseoli]|uniref:Uncharacterized protein n=1 Tax=Fontibacillus phaseoli TaxID=1416533 RepID=A0A369BPV1_9BACL|nr:hypothetical protein [Fontibacillus phaseoli]RCX23650.1 hypothetical protein DFP94_1011252 [Fontibacillus phaseoli]